MDYESQPAVADSGQRELTVTHPHKTTALGRLEVYLGDESATQLRAGLWVELFTEDRGVKESSYSGSEREADVFGRYCMKSLCCLRLKYCSTVLPIHYIFSQSPTELTIPLWKKPSSKMHSP